MAKTTYVRQLPTSSIGDIAKMYEPGGSFTTGVKSSLDRSRAKFMSSGMQSLVSSGLSNTTMAAGLAGKFAEEVEAPTLASAESTRVSELSRILMFQAQQAQQAQQFQAQQEQAQAQLQMQYYLNKPPSLASQGLDAFGRPMYDTQPSAQPSATKPKADTQPDFTALFNKIKSLSAPVYYQPSNASSTSASTGTMSSTMASPQTWSSEEIQALNKQMGNVSAQSSAQPDYTALYNNIKAASTSPTLYQPNTTKPTWY